MEPTTSNSLRIVRRYFTAALGAGLAMAIYILTTYRSEAIFTSQRWGTAITLGTTFAVYMGAVVVLTSEPTLLFPPHWSKVRLFLVRLGVGTLLSALVFALY